MASRENQPAEILPATLLEAYRMGVFPMNMDGKLAWFSPDPRGIIPLDGFHLPHGLRRALNGNRWEIRVDSCFEEVIGHCADRTETWIDACILRSYRGLHKLGCAHSVEAWVDGKLAGGLYGVRLGAAFFGESMFHHVTNASKVALAALVAILRRGNFQLLDTQWTTDHLRQFGAVDVPRPSYLQLLQSATEINAKFPAPGVWEKQIGGWKFP